MNPGQSVKDRAALYIIRDAVARGYCDRAAPSSKGRRANTGIRPCAGGGLDGLSHRHP